MSLYLRQDEKRLLQKAMQGNPQAQRDLYRRYVQAMYNTVIRMVSTEMDAEDIVQEAFIKVFQNLRQFKGESTIGAWIKRIVINTALNFLRSHKRISYLSAEIAEKIPQPSEAEGPETDIRKIHQAIKILPEGCRIVFTLYLLEGYQHKEIAQILEISESTSKSQYQRARRLLRRELKDVATA